MKIGDYVRTPRFCTVKIAAMFAEESEARKCGYTEPTYYEGGDYTVLGKSLDMYHMWIKLASAGRFPKFISAGKFLLRDQIRQRCRI